MPETILETFATLQQQGLEALKQAQVGYLTTAAQIVEQQNAYAKRLAEIVTGLQRDAVAAAQRIAESAKS